jgi:hypothetical protein
VNVDVAVSGPGLDDGFERQRIVSIEGVDSIADIIDAAIVDALGDRTLKEIVHSQAGKGSRMVSRT